MNANLKMAFAMAAVVIVVAAAAFYYFTRPAETPGPVGPPVADGPPQPEPTPTPTLAEQLSERLEGVTLATADIAVRELVSELSERPELLAWLANEDLVRRFTAAVDNIADGRSPRTHLEFLAPKTGFGVRGPEDDLRIDPSCYRRYDLAAEVVASLDTEGAVALYTELLPLFREAYREIAPPGADFNDRMIEAIDHLGATPDAPAAPQVELKVVTYTYADEKLESLSAAQRHLLRMGPDNAAAVKAKLAEFKAGLMPSEDELESGP